MELGAVIVRAFVPMAALALGASLAAAGQQPAIEGKTVTAVRVVSTRGQVIETNPANLRLVAGKPYSTDSERAALKQLFATGLYADIQTEATPEPGGVRIDFVVKQNDFIGVVRVEGLEPPPREPEALAAMNLELGHAFTTEGLDEALAALRQALADDGLYRAVLTPELDRHPGNHLMNITVLVKPGPRARLGAIAFQNHSRFSDRDLLRRTKLGPGKPVTANRISTGTDRLRRYLAGKNYLTARVGAERGPYDTRHDTVPLTIRVDAGPAVRVVLEGAHVGGRQLKKLIPIYEEGAVDPDLLEEGRRNLLDYFQRNGYFDSQVSYQTAQDTKQNLETITYDIERGAKSKLVGVAFSGNRYFGSDLLASRLQIQPAAFPSPGRFSPRLLEGDVDSIRGVYLASGFRDVLVKADVVHDYEGRKNHLFVRFLIDEGPQTRISLLAIQGNRAIPTKELLGVVGSTAGQPYSEANITNDRDNILALYYNRGFPEASFSSAVKDSGPNRVALTYEIEEGSPVRVNRVILLGYRHTRPGVIRRRVTIEAGQPLREADIVTTQDQLYNLGIFNRVDIATENPSSPLASKNVLVETREGDRYTIGYGGGLDMQRLGSTTSSTSTVFDVAPLGIFEFSKLNVFGRAQTLSFKARGSTIEYNGLLSYQIPSLLQNPKFNLVISGFAGKSRDVNTFTGSQYQGALQVVQNYSRSTSFLYGYTFRRVVVDASTLKINPEQVPLYSQPTRVSGFGFTWVRDRRDNPAEATRGSYNNADFNLYAIPLGSSASFTRFFFQNSTYTPLARSLVFARSTRFGFEEAYGDSTAGDIPLPERLWAGGGTSLRGFGLNQAGPRDPVTGFPVGGLAELIFNQDLRFPMRLPIVGNAVGGTLFYDAGNVFSSLDAITMAWKPSSPSQLDYFSHTIGLGLRYATPVGPVRFDVGYLLNPAQFELSCTTGTAGCANGVRLSRLPRVQFFFNIGSAF